MRVTSFPPPPLPPLPSSSQRPQIKRMTQQELNGLRYSNEYESPSSTNRMVNTRQSQIVPEVRESWQPIYPTPPKEPEPNPRDQCLQNRAWFWVFGAVFCLILVIAVVAIVLGIVLPMTTTAAPDGTTSGRFGNVKSVTEPTTVCSKISGELIGSLKGSTTFGWKSYSFDYVAKKTSPILSFAFQTFRMEKFYFDRVSVKVKNDSSSIELLSNPNFDSSRSDRNGWAISCQSSCSPVTSQIIDGAECYDKTSSCLQIQCSANHSSLTFIRQSFLAELEQIYTIQFLLNQEPGDSSFFLNVE